MKRRDLMDAIIAYHDAVKIVIKNWEAGDLASGVRNLVAVDNKYGAPAVQWWENDE